MSSATVYLLYGSEGKLLYVGASIAASNRLGYHSSTQPWWTLVERAEFRHFETRDDALIEEARLIRELRPLFNVQGRSEDELRARREQKAQAQPAVVSRPTTQLERRRLDARLTPEQLADRSGVCSRTIRRLEAGKHRAHDKTLFALAEALGARPAELLSVSQEPAA